MDNKVIVALLQSGKPQALAPESAANLPPLVIQLLESCSGREKKLMSEEDWNKAKSSAQCVWLHAVDPFTVEIKASRQKLPVLEILVPLDASGKPPNIVLARRGPTIYSAFTAYSQTTYDVIRKTAFSRKKASGFEL